MVTVEFIKSGGVMFTRQFDTRVKALAAGEQWKLVDTRNKYTIVAVPQSRARPLKRVSIICTPSKGIQIVYRYVSDDSVLGIGGGDKIRVHKNPNDKQISVALAAQKRLLAAQ